MLLLSRFLLYTFLSKLMMNNQRTNSSRTNSSTRSVTVSRPSPSLEESIMEGLQLINSRLEALERHTPVPPGSANDSDPATIITYTRPTISPTILQPPSTSHYTLNQYGRVTLAMVPFQFASPVMVVTLTHGTNSGSVGPPRFSGPRLQYFISILIEHRQIFSFGQYSPSVTTVGRCDPKKPQHCWEESKRSYLNCGRKKWPAFVLLNH